MTVLGIKIGICNALNCIFKINGSFDKHYMPLFITYVLTVVLRVGKKGLKNKITIHAFKEVRIFSRKSTEVSIARDMMKSIETESRLMIVRGWVRMGNDSKWAQRNKRTKVLFFFFFLNDEPQIYFFRLDCSLFFFN